jgi:hypothetical protein
MNSSRQTVRVSGLTVGTVTTMGTITEITQPDPQHYVVTFDNGGSCKFNFLQALVVITGK